MLRSILRRQKTEPKILAPNAGRGRLYAPQPVAEASFMEPVAAKGKATITARVYREETDTWEDIGVLVDDAIIKQLQEQ